MQSELLRVYKQFESNPDVLFLSHTIDPAHDSIPVLRDYAERLGIQGCLALALRHGSPRHHFCAGQGLHDRRPEVDRTVQGGFAHSGTFALVDSKRRIRGVYDGMVKKPGGPADPGPAHSAEGRSGGNKPPRPQMRRRLLRWACSAVAAVALTCWA